MSTLFRRIAVVAAVLVAAAALAAPDGWLKTMDEGVAAGKKSGKAVLVVTGWTNEQ